MQNPKPRPSRRAKNLIILGAFLVFLSVVVKAAAVYYLFEGGFFAISSNPHNQLSPSFLSKSAESFLALGIQQNPGGTPSGFWPASFAIFQVLADLEFEVLLLLAVGFVMFLILVISALKINSDDAGRTAKWAKVAFILAIIFPLTAITLPQMLFENEVFLLPNFIITNTRSSLYSQNSEAQLLGTLSSNFANTQFALAAAVVTFAMLLGASLGIVGAVYGLGAKNKHFMINSAIVLGIVVAALTALSYYSVKNDNAAALNNLNSQILVQGANMRYLLTNYSFNSNSSLFSSFLPVFAPRNDLSGFLTTPYSTSKTQLSTKALSYSDFGAYNPIVRNMTLFTLYELGALNLIPANQVRVSTFESLYQIQVSGADVLLLAVGIGQLFPCAFHNPASVSNSSFSQEVGVAVPGYTDESSASSFATSEFIPSYSGNGAYGSGSGFYLQDVVGKDISYVAPGWIALEASINYRFNKMLNQGYASCSSTVPHYNSTAGTFSNVTTSYTVPLKDIFYIYSLSQYSTYPYLEAISNETSSPWALHPEIESMTYLDSKLIVNLGDLDLSNPGGVTLYVDGNQTGYLRYFNYLLANKTIAVGIHNVTAVINGSSSSAPLYVSPFLSVRSLMSGNKLSLTIWNPFSTPTSAENLNLSQVSPYVTGPQYVFPDFNLTSTNAPQNFTLASNQSMTLNYTISGSCGVLQRFKYYLTMDTNRGKAVYIVGGKCV